MNYICADDWAHFYCIGGPDVCGKKAQWLRSSGAAFSLRYSGWRSYTWLSLRCESSKNSSWSELSQVKLKWHLDVLATVLPTASRLNHCRVSKNRPKKKRKKRYTWWHSSFSSSLTYIQLDYFHPSLIGHQHMAKALWNSMLTPAASKRTYSNADEPFVCPDSSTLLYTNWSIIVTAHPNFCLCFVLLVHKLKPFTFYFLTL